MTADVRVTAEVTVGMPAAGSKSGADPMAPGVCSELTGGEPHTPSPKPRTLRFESYTLNPEQQTHNSGSKPRIPTAVPYTLNPFARHNINRGDALAAGTPG